MDYGYQNNNQNVYRVMKNCCKNIKKYFFILVFCPNPGPLSNGRIYVILKDERISSLPIRSEFRSYIPNVSHGRTIEFECNLGKMLIYIYCKRLLLLI